MPRKQRIVMFATFLSQQRHEHRIGRGETFFAQPCHGNNANDPEFFFTIIILPMIQLRLMMQLITMMQVIALLSEHDYWITGLTGLTTHFL